MDFAQCPYSLSREEVEGGDLPEMVELCAASDQLEHGLCRLRTPMRFDFDPENNTEVHPGAHVHMQHGDCRCGSVGAISVGKFVKFVFRTAYPHIWVEHGFLRELPEAELERCNDCLRTTDVHFAWDV